MLATTITRTVVKQTLTPTTAIPTTSTPTMQTTERAKKHQLFTKPVQPLAKPTILQGNFILEPIQLITPWDRRPERQNQVQQRDNQNNSNESLKAAAQTLN